MSAELENFDELLSHKKTNDMIEALIRDQAFSVSFIASCIAHYYLKNLKKRKSKEPR